MPESQEASESFVKLSHISARTFQRPLTHYLSWIYLGRTTCLLFGHESPVNLGW